MRAFLLTAFSILIATVLASACSAVSGNENELLDDRFEIKKEDGDVAIYLDGELLTRYVVKSGNKPIMWPLTGPSGLKMTRSYPMTEGVENERTDHPHHRSFWFTHGDVNGISFWHEADDTGEIVHREFVEASGGDEATISTINDWIAPDGTKLCEDKREFRFGAKDQFRWIDAVVTVTGTADEVKFGDTKEGSFGVRVAGTMREELGLGGRIVTSEGAIGAGEAWGKPARWVDYQGPVDEQTVGIAIMNHPTSYGFPSHWHVRGYGLFAANPFGLHDFYGSDSGKDGTLVLGAGDSFTLKYRVLIHPGDHEEGQVEAFYEDYVK